MSENIVEPYYDDVTDGKGYSSSDIINRLSFECRMKDVQIQELKEELTKVHNATLEKAAVFFTDRAPVYWYNDAARLIRTLKIEEKQNG